MTSADVTNRLEARTSREGPARKRRVIVDRAVGCCHEESVVL